MSKGAVFVVLIFAFLVCVPGARAENPCEELKTKPSQATVDACALYLVEIMEAVEEAKSPCEEMRTNPSRATVDACALYLVRRAAERADKGKKATSRSVPDPAAKEAEETVLRKRDSAADQYCDIALYGSLQLEQTHRAYGILADLLKKANLKEQIALCVWETGEGTYRVGVINISARAIGGSRDVYTELSDAAMRGFIGHDMGHIVCGHKDDGNNDTPQEYAEADAVAIRLVGEGALRETLSAWNLDENKINNRIDNARKAPECK